MNRCYWCILGLHAHTIYSDVISFCTERVLFENSISLLKELNLLLILNSSSHNNDEGIHQGGAQSQVKTQKTRL